MDNKHYNLLIPSEVTSLSNIIASVIYNTANTKNVHESAERFNALTLIRNLCLNQTNHYPVNSTNYYCFLDRIKDNFQTSFEEFAALPHVSPIMSVIQHYKQLMELHVERERWRDLIHRHDLKKCLSDYFTRKLTFFYDCVIDLKAIDETLNCFIVEVKHKDSPKVEKKGDHIGLAYALLNFKTSKANTILCALLQRLALNKPLEENELAFLNYLWNNFGRKCAMSVMKTGNIDYTQKVERAFK
ncbi:hypothetical protein FQA39_LY17478 [Lamprigera yunnana]|nr:hypothetical protein FQA39_LY17478 [Lamprigera yunnana]